MENPETERKPFNEREALEELERFRQDIERYRSRRKALGEEFEQFIRSFEKPEEVRETPAAAVSPKPPAPALESAPKPMPPTEPAPKPLTPAVEAAPKPPILNIEPAPKPLTPAGEAAPKPMPRTGPAPRPLTPPVETAPKPPAPALESARKPLTPAVETAPLPGAPVAPIPGPPMQRPSGARARMLLGALMALILGGWAAWTFWPDARESASVTTAPVTPAAVPSPAPAPASPTPETFATELTTTRPVWVRVIADGERVVERELPADARVPLKAQKTIVVRTGDAGAVRLTIAGQDQGPLGNAGEVVTRTFNVPGGPPR